MFSFIIPVFSNGECSVRNAGLITAIGYSLAEGRIVNEINRQLWNRAIALLNEY